MSSESSVKLIEDWRERWEAVTAHGRPIVAVAEIGGKCIEVWALASIGVMATYAECYLIPKPRPKTFRPWKREEVPVGSVVRDKHSAYVQLITSATESYIGMSSFVRSPRELFDSFVMHLTNPDGSWVPTEQCPPCGIEE